LERSSIQERTQGGGHKQRKDEACAEHRRKDKSQRIQKGMVFSEQGDEGAKTDQAACSNKDGHRLTRGFPKSKKELPELKFEAGQYRTKE